MPVLLPLLLNQTAGLRLRACGAANGGGHGPIPVEETLAFYGRKSEDTVAQLRAPAEASSAPQFSFLLCPPQHTRSAGYGSVAFRERYATSTRLERGPSPELRRADAAHRSLSGLPPQPAFLWGQRPQAHGGPAGAGGACGRGPHGGLAPASRSFGARALLRRAARPASTAERYWSEWAQYRASPFGWRRADGVLGGRHHLYSGGAGAGRKPDDHGRPTPAGGLRASVWRRW